jgi:hypothetical protein
MTTCPSVFGPAPVPWAGGVAHDPRDRHTWVSNGPLLAKVNPRTGCTVKCAPFTAPNLNTGQVVTGLAYNEDTNRLFISHSDNRILTYSVAANGCTLTLVSQCQVTGLPGNHVISGLATDDVNSRIYFATWNWLGTSGQPFAEFWAAPQNSPCAPACGPFLVSDCAINPPAPMSRVTGLGFDTCGPGGGTLYITNSLGITAVQVTGCSPTPVGCCSPLLPGVQFAGLCVLPPDEVASLGPGCTAGTPVCSPLHTMTGDSTLGNQTFSLDLSNAPGAALAILFWNAGPPLPTLSLGLCANVLPNFPWPGSVGLTTGVVNTCTGTRSAPTPLPNNPSLCGAQVSTRWAGVAWPINFANNFVSNALTWTISGS